MPRAYPKFAFVVIFSQFRSRRFAFKSKQKVVIELSELNYVRNGS